MRVTLGLVAVLLTGALLVPSAGAGHLGPGNLRAVHANVLVYDADPPAPHNGTPFVWVDRVHALPGLPRGEGGGPQSETFPAYEAAYLDRNAVDATVGVTLSARADADVLRVDVDVAPRGGGPNGTVRLVGVAFHPAASLDGRTVPFLAVPGSDAQATLPPRDEAVRVTLDLAAGGADPGDLGALVRVETLGGPNASAWVLQSASWMPGQSGPTVQLDKAVLVEAWTRADCPPCMFAEDAVAELARTYGHDPTGGDARYLTDAPGWVWAVALLAAGGGAALVWRAGPGGRRG